MSSNLMKDLFVRLNGRILKSPHRAGAETWVLRKPSATSARIWPASIQTLSIRRQMIKAFRLAAAIMLHGRSTLRGQPSHTRHPDPALTGFMLRKRYTTQWR